MTSNEIRQKFLKFFENRGHKVLPSASLIPENDPSVLFNTAGMQPIVPYLLGQTHPMGTRLVDAQKCIRTNDIDEVGDNRHLTFFEMLGNWSLGDYFKEDAIKWSFQFLTDKEEGLGLDINRIYVTVFEGNNDAPRDTDAFTIWKKYLPEGRIYFLPAKNNWWSAGDNGPCGADTEIFYDPSEEPIGDMTHDQFVKADDEGKVIEIWNNVFMEYEKADGKVVGKLAKHNVDTGMGFERITMVVQKMKTVFDTDLFDQTISMIEELSDLKYGDKTDEEYMKNGDQCWVDNRKLMRIIADHIRTSVFIIADGVSVDRSYFDSDETTHNKICNFTISHEAYHAFKHRIYLKEAENQMKLFSQAKPTLPRLKRLITLQRDLSGKASNQFCLQANMFASFFTMPRERVRKALLENIGADSIELVEGNDPFEETKKIARSHIGQHFEINTTPLAIALKTYGFVREKGRSLPLFR